ncbi:MAG: DUF6580 family putative transport protein [Akkermansiaceae bacterium]
MKNFLPMSLLVVLLLCFRVASLFLPDTMQNIMPFAAVFFCAGVFAKSCPQLLPAALIAFILGGPIASLVQGSAAFGWVDVINISTMLLILVIGWKYQGTHKLLPLLGGTLLGAVAFYLITNTGSFLMSSYYAKTWQGYGQALWTGTPPYAPTWMFFRNSLCANTLFTILFYASLKLPAFQQAKRFGLEPLPASH